MTARKSSRKKPQTEQAARWPLAAAKAHLAEIVRRARKDGPQILTSHGKAVAEIRIFDEPKPKTTRTLHDFYSLTAARGIDLELTLPERVHVTHREFSFDD
ncbi:MAG: type II toxin-antitoxin system prevent-host-death family antitoxin [Alphaproteobacteria bacterium]|nr:type II toxin-antitoxin system prevent-host-death family antitoxin [Alphaproteobacteria bacterium]